MDQEANSVRRRSLRLAARGITTTPKAKTAVKKIAKSSEKPKRAKRKTAEEVIELPEAKKTKTDDKPDNEIKDPKEETNNVEKNYTSAVIAPMDVDSVKTNVFCSSTVKNNNALQTDENTPLKDSKEEIIEKTSSKVEKDIIVAPAADDKILEVIKEPIKVTEQEKNDVALPVALDNNMTNSESDDKKSVELVVEAVKNDIGFCVTKDPATPNGNIVEQLKATNGENKSEETIKIINANTNRIVETDLKSVTINNAAITTSNNLDTSSVEQVEAKFVNNTIDSASVLSDDNTPSSVDQTSTFVS